MRKAEAGHLRCPPRTSSPRSPRRSDARCPRPRSTPASRNESRSRSRPASRARAPATEDGQLSSEAHLLLLFLRAPMLLPSWPLLLRVVRCGRGRRGRHVEIRRVFRGRRGQQTHNGLDSRHMSATQQRAARAGINHYFFFYSKT